MHKDTEENDLKCSVKGNQIGTEEKIKSPSAAGGRLIFNQYRPTPGATMDGNSGCKKLDALHLASPPPLHWHKWAQCWTCHLTGPENTTFLDMEQRHWRETLYRIARNMNIPLPIISYVPAFLSAVTAHYQENFFSYL